MNKWAFLLLALSVCTWLVFGEEDADCPGAACAAAAAPPEAEAPLPTVPYAAFVDLAGQLHLLRRDALGRISEAVWGPNVTLVDGTARTPGRAPDGRVLLAGGEHDYVLGPAAGVIRGPRISFDGEHASAGLGFTLPPQGSAGRAHPQGHYRVLGHVCAPGAVDCLPQSGWLSLAADGTLRYCEAVPGARPAACAEPLEDRLDLTADDAGWTTRRGGRVIASAGDGALLVYTVQTAGAGRQVLHAVRDDALAAEDTTSAIDTPRRAWASSTGDARLDVDVHGAAAVPGTSGRDDGLPTLASASGVVVRWTADRGLAVSALY